jgi:hypothetical protein
LGIPAKIQILQENTWPLAHVFDKYILNKRVANILEMTAVASQGRAAMQVAAEKK